MLIAANTHADRIAYCKPAAIADGNGKRIRGIQDDAIHRTILDSY